MCIQPAFERAKFFSQLKDPLCVDDGRIDFQAVTDDASIFHQAGAFLLRVLRNLLDLEVIIGLAKVLRLFQNRDPRQASLVDLKDEPLEEQIVVMERKSILCVVIGPVVGVPGMGFAVVAVGSRGAILTLSRVKQDGKLSMRKSRGIREMPTVHLGNP